MATRRTTSDKRQRERAKQAKAAEKRARRLEKASDDAVETPAIDDDGTTTDQLLQRIEALHASFDAGTLSFEDFEQQRSELVDQLAIRLAQ
jgi:hypothetical protein